MQTKKTTVTTTTTMTTNHQIEVHREWLNVYNSLVAISSGDPSVRLTDDQKAAYMAIPTVLDECQSSFDAIAPDCPGRPSHYLLYV